MIACTRTHDPSVKRQQVRHKDYGNKDQQRREAERAGQEVDEWKQRVE